MMQPNKLILSLKKILGVLAAPAQEQAAYIEQLGTTPLIDELALEFDELFVLVPQLAEQGLLTPQQVGKLNVLNDKLSKMSNTQSTWLIPALFEMEEWQEVRLLANSCLDSINSL